MNAHNYDDDPKRTIIDLSSESIDGQLSSHDTQKIENQETQKIAKPHKSIEEIVAKSHTAHRLNERKLENYKKAIEDQIHTPLRVYGKNIKKGDYFKPVGITQELIKNHDYLGEIDATNCSIDEFVEQLSKYVFVRQHELLSHETIAEVGICRQYPEDIMVQIMQLDRSLEYSIYQKQLEHLTEKADSTRIYGIWVKPKKYSVSIKNTTKTESGDLL